jgi:uncharacterized membrane protein
MSVEDPVPGGAVGAVERPWRGRIDLIDALRGLAVALMVIHHALFDAVEFLGAPGWLFSNPVFDILHYLFAGIFIMLAGVSSRFSRSNIGRGAKVLAIAVGITAVTLLLRMPIWFGILHLLGFCMLLYGLAGKALDRLPSRLAPFLYAGLTVLSSLAVSRIPVASHDLWILGWTYPGFSSADYFPFFPWLFVFLFGAWLGKLIVENRFPAWFYATSVPALPAAGRHALIIYVLHQPVLYGLAMAALYLAGR